MLMSPLQACGCLEVFALIDLKKTGKKSIEASNTVLIHTAFGSWPMLEYELDIAQREIDDGNHVIFLITRHDQLSCECKKERYCKESHSRTMNGISWLKNSPGSFEVLEFESANFDEEAELKCILDSLEGSDDFKDSLKGINFLRGMDIYESAVSTVATNVCVSNPTEIEFRKEILQYIEIGIRSYYSARNHLKSHNVDKIFLYNGRMARYRPLLRLAQKDNIVINVYEYPLLGFMNYIMIQNQYPHDFANISKELLKYFRSSTLTYEDKISLGEKWFENRVDKPGQVKDVLLPKFNERMHACVMPQQWNQNAFNLVFFVSSEYEIADIVEVKSTHPYSQDKIVERINSLFPDINIYVRMHPGLEGVEKELVEKMTNLDQLKNVSVIPSKSPIDSYELMKMANLILSFGSTVGIESAYLKKPVITVGASWYQEFQADINIRTDQELVDSITNATEDDFSNFPLPGERRSRACEFCYSFQNFGEKPKYLTRDTFHGGFMVRNDSRLQIKPDFRYVLVNRLMDLPKKIVNEGWAVISDKDKFNKWMKNPLRITINKLFNSYY